MRLLAKNDAFAENKLFATVDSTVRKIVIEQIPCLLTDTVGFIRKSMGKGQTRGWPWERGKRGAGHGKGANAGMAMGKEQTRGWPWEMSKRGDGHGK